MNTVARMEGLNRDLGTAILVSGAIVAAVPGGLITTDRGSVSLKGKVQPIRLFELSGVGDEATIRA